MADNIAKFVTPENEKELSAKADATLTLYNKKIGRAHV